MKDPDVIDVVFEEVEPTFRIRLWPVLWWTVFTGGVMMAAKQDGLPAMAIVYIGIAALSAPVVRLSSWAWNAVRGPPVSEQAALRLRRRLLGR